MNFKAVGAGRKDRGECGAGDRGTDECGEGNRGTKEQRRVWGWGKGKESVE